MNRRIWIERQAGFTIEAAQLQEDLHHTLGIDVPELRYLISYDLFDLSEETHQTAVPLVFLEANRDTVLDHLPTGYRVLAYEPLPGQFDARASAAMDCLRLIDPTNSSWITSGITILLPIELETHQIQAIRRYLINPVESREKDLSRLERSHPSRPIAIPYIQAFRTLDETALCAIHERYRLAMSMEDLRFVQTYFQQEQRDPTETELRVLDTYWSDHCRHTTFETAIDTVRFPIEDSMQERIQATYRTYQSDRTMIGRENRPITLMDLATINAKRERFLGRLDDLELSDEVNAASLRIEVDVAGQREPWFLMCKNETHNHPTEIEPFGGASTCIGGAIRDPLSGRSYVYSAMRITGAADLHTSFESTLDGKLPQRIISKEAAHGYSSYGNQIGLATPFVEELHHPGYVAKRLEIGAVLGAVPANQLVRNTPVEGDLVLLLGGRTGRDGIGGATGSSKEHNVNSIDESASEVQKGNAPEERKLQRLFRNPEVSRRIKKANDFGAGGVSVAVGELADGIDIDLNAIPTKYLGIDGTELAISESQERMAIVIDPSDLNVIREACHSENVEVSIIARITKDNRMIMRWNNQIICDLDRHFIDTAGVRQHIDITSAPIDPNEILVRRYEGERVIDQWIAMMQDPNVASKQGMEEMFDSSIGRSTVLAPYGGRHALTKTQVACQLIPTRRPDTRTASVLAYGFNPYLSERSPYHGAIYAVLQSMAKLVATGVPYSSIRFLFQEYFEKLQADPLRWSKPFHALLGAYDTLRRFGLAAIGGKDSMSGTYQDLHVPPTLVSFAVSTIDIRNIVQPMFQQAGSHLYLYDIHTDDLDLPDIELLQRQYDDLHNRIQSGTIRSAYAIGHGGLAEAIAKASFGERIGARLDRTEGLFDWRYGAILVESSEPIPASIATYLGHTIEQPVIALSNEEIRIQQLITANQSRYDDLYPRHPKQTIAPPIDPIVSTRSYSLDVPFTKDVRVLIPVFPGTNCEYDSEDAWIQAGAKTEILVFQNQTKADIEESMRRLARAIRSSHILFLAGGFSSGDEPDGSGKFIANVLRHPDIKQAIEDHLAQRRLILGICNGFQALVKSGLLPNGEIRTIEPDAPTLFKNILPRHIARFVHTRVGSLHSPWMSGFQLGDIHTVPVSHGEGRFLVSHTQYEQLRANHQIAFQYADEAGNATMDPDYNPNGSAYAIEGLLSADGLILGKMAHSERYQTGLFQNVPGNKTQDLFGHAVRYFQG
jgi:phosphoribosylformylglycinamidine synthase